MEKLLERTFDVKANILDSIRLLVDTGWRAKVEFTDGILSTYEWLQRQKNE